MSIMAKCTGCRMLEEENVILRTALAAVLTDIYKNHHNFLPTGDRLNEMIEESIERIKKIIEKERSQDVGNNG